MAGAPKDEVRELLLLTAKLIVDHTEDVSVKIFLEPNRTIFLLKVNPKDVGKLIGAGGRMASSLRWLFDQVGGQSHERYAIQIEEPRRGAAVH